MKRDYNFTNIEFFKLDVSDKKEVEATWHKIISKYKKVNILINNAAIARGKKFLDLSFEQYVKTQEINYFAYVQFM